MIKNVHFIHMALEQQEFPYIQTPAMPVHWQAVAMYFSEVLIGWLEKSSVLQDITNLNRQPSLRELGLKSAEYAPNPIGLLCNYSTHILYHLPNILRLDNQDISNKSLRELAEVFILPMKSAVWPVSAVTVLKQM